MDKTEGMAEPRPRRRQARGERRMAQLVDAAGRVFAKVGYAAASTNAIAREAGVSPGTFYQFFPNKEAIAAALGRQLQESLEVAYGMGLAPENAGLPLAEVLDAVLDPVIEFNLANPAFLALINGSESLCGTMDKAALGTTLLSRVEQLIALRVPDLTPLERRIAAEFSFAMVKTGLEMLVVREGPARAATIAEMKRALYAYLAPLVGEGPVDIYPG